MRQVTNTSNCKKNNAMVIGRLMSLPSYSHTPPKQPTQTDIDFLTWITVEQVDISFNAVDSATQKRARGAKTEPPVWCLITDIHTDLALRLCSTMTYKDGTFVYNQKHLSLYGSLPCDTSKLTVAAIEANKNVVWFNFKVFCYNRKDDIPKDIQWHPDAEKRLAELVEDSQKKARAKMAVKRSSDGFLVHEANDEGTGPKGNALTSFVNFSAHTTNGNSALQAMPNKGGFGKMKIKGKDVKAPGAQGMLFKECLWVTPCNDDQRAEAKANENATRIQELIDEKIYPGQNKVWVSNHGK